MATAAVHLPSLFVRSIVTVVILSLNPTHPISSLASQPGLQAFPPPSPPVKAHLARGLPVLDLTYNRYCLLTDLNSHRHQNSAIIKFDSLVLSVALQTFE